MTSLIDATKPVYGNPTTQSVRDNFLHAYDEITDLQTKTAGAPFLPISGGVMDGPITMQSDPLNPLEVATKSYVDTLAFGDTGGTPEAPVDGLFYARGNTTGGNTWSHDPLFTSVHFGPDRNTDRWNIGSDATYNFLKMSTGNDFFRLNRNNTTFEIAVDNVVNQSWSSANSTFTVPVVLPGNPTGSLQAATKQYVDTNSISQTAADARYVNITGDTLSGDLILSKTNPAIRLNTSGGSQASTIYGQNGATVRWGLELGNSLAAGDFSLNRYDDAGAYTNSPLVIARNDGRARFNNGITINGSDLAALEGGTGYAIWRFNNSASRWWMGASTDGNFIIFDDSAQRQLMAFQTDGNIRVSTEIFTDRLTSYGIITAGGDITGANITSQGSLGIKYYGQNNWFRFSWDGSFINGWIDGGNVVHQLANVGWVNGSFVTKRTANQLGFDYSSGAWYYGAHDTATWFYASVAWTSPCDERTKTDSLPTKVDALDVIRRLPVEEWHTKPEVLAWLGHGKSDEIRDRIRIEGAFTKIGITAQRAAEVDPNLVYVADQSKPIEGKPEGSPLPDDMLQCEPTKFMPYLVRAIQQLCDKVDALEAKQ